MIKRLVKQLALAAGYEVRRFAREPGGAARPISEIASFLEDVRARDLAPRGIIDVGANAGGWARMALGIFPGTPLIAIEPQEEMTPYLRALCAEHPQCTTIKAGAGPSEGEQVQTIWEDLAGSSFLPSADTALLQSGKQRKTRMTTLDRVLAEAPAGF